MVQRIRLVVFYSEFAVRKIKMKKEDNLRKWPKGVSGNPKGRKPGSKNRSTIVKDILAKKIKVSDDQVDDLKDYFEEIPNQISVEELMTLSMIRKVIIDGSVSAYVALMDSAYGKFKEISTENGLFENYTAEELEAMVYLPGDDIDVNQSLD